MGVGHPDTLSVDRSEPDVSDDPVAPRKRKRCRGDHGDVIPSIVVLPVLLIMMLLVVQAGFAYHARQVMATAAQDGAALEAASPGSGKALTDELVTNAVGGLVNNYSSSVGSNGEDIIITTTAQATKVFPLFPTLTLTASGAATIERFEPQP